jgi:hypothetical protein
MSGEVACCRLSGSLYLNEVILTWDLASVLQFSTPRGSITHQRPPLSVREDDMNDQLGRVEKQA